MRTVGDNPPATLPPVYVELDGRLYELTVVPEIPKNSRGEPCLMHVEGNARTIRVHRSVTLPEISLWIARTFRLDPQIVWKPCESNVPVSHPLPMLTISD